MPEFTSASLIYRGVVVDSGLANGDMRPIISFGWGTTSGHIHEDDVRQTMMDRLIQANPDRDPSDMRIVECTWTTIAPVEIPDVRPRISLRKENPR